MSRIDFLSLNKNGVKALIEPSKTMKRNIFLLLLIIICSCKEDENVDNVTQPPFSYEFNKRQLAHGSDQTLIPYHFFKPQQAINSDREFPLIVALHGVEYMLVPQDDFLVHSPSNYMATAWIEEEKQTEFPAYVVAPHLYDELVDKEGYERWTENLMQDFLNQLLDFIIEDNNVDINSIYFIGHSAGGGSVWTLNETLKSRIAAIVPISHANWDMEEFNVLEQINNGVFDDLSVWNFVHRRDLEQSVITGREIFNHLREGGLEPVITHTLGIEDFNLTDNQIEEEISAGKPYFYTEYNTTCGTDNPGCHYSMTIALNDPLFLKWLFMQKKE